MKVFYLTPGCFDKGGISRYSRYQISALRMLVGKENVFVFSVLGPSNEDFEDAFDVTYFASGTSKLKQLAFTTKLYSAAIMNRPDIIISAHVNLSGLAKVLAKLTGAKSVLNVYGAEAWSAMRRDAEWGLRSSDYVISDCHFTARYLEEKGFRPNGSISVVWDCVDLDRFYPASPGQTILSRYGIPDPAQGLNILTLGRMSSDTAYKGYERLLDVFSRIAPAAPKANLIYAGRGQMVEHLRVQAKALGLSERVFFTGMVHEDDLADIYRSAHVFSLVTNRGEGNGEGIPLTPLEAAACGVPLIVGNHDGSQEAVVEGVDGFIVDPFDLEGHAKAILTLATDDELRTRMGQAARNRAELEFAFPKFLAKHEELLETWFSDHRSIMLRKDAEESLINL
jgi:phosphatidylinositol alpha-1,6-mannosyltransferase